MWLVLVAVYVLSPVDLFPDFLGLPGRVDDILIALVGLYYYYANAPGKTRKGRRGSAGRGAGARQQKRESSETGDGPGTGHKQDDPYEVLGVKCGDSLSEIRGHYKEKLLHYHPDRVQHLGGELQELAERKTKELNEAYQKILKEQGERG